MSTSVSMTKPGGGTPGPSTAPAGPPEAVVPLTAIHPVARVDLMPPGVRAVRRFRRARGFMALAVLVTVAAAGAVYLVSWQDARNAQEDLATEQARAAALQSQAAQYAQVPALLSTIDRAQASLTTAMSTEIAWYPYLDDLSRSAPESVWFDQVSMTAAGPSASGAATAAAVVDPLADPTAVATVSMRGGALSHQDVVAWLNAMSGLVTWEDPLVSQSAVDPEGDQSILFETSARLSADAFTHRYDSGLPEGAGSATTPEGGL